MLQVVWFKRDLRAHDHAALTRAAARGPVLALWVYEPGLWAEADAAPQHLAFAEECLVELDAWCAAAGGRLWRHAGTTEAALERVRARHGAFTLHSHEETGNAWTYARDRRVAAWCRERGIEWQEAPSNGVVRRLRSRDVWSRAWTQRMDAAVLPAPTSIAWAALPDDGCGRVAPARLGLAGHDKPLRQPGGRRAALGLLDSFLHTRSRTYRHEMSSPATAESACSRLSPHLAWGTLSIRECAHATWARRASVQALEPAQRPEGLLAGLRSFESRLHWHCHFIQKLESEPAIERANVHHGFDGLRNEGVAGDVERARLQAFRSAQTGVPFVDACLRSLEATGWINFRMRAMLVSFSSYQLWLHWREPGLHLARQFLDYEPGIHWPQVQMQSGVTGINTIRMYNPVKQGHDQDPDGSFVRRWIPELAQVPAPYLHEPWRLPTSEQQRWACRLGTDYPDPIVDLAAAAREAKSRIHDRRAAPGVREEAQRVYDRHGSRNPTREGPPRRPRTPKPAPADPQQLSLLDD